MEHNIPATDATTMERRFNKLEAYDPYRRFEGTIFQPPNEIYPVYKREDMKRVILIAVIVLCTSAAIYQLAVPPAFAQIVKEKALTVTTADGRVQGKSDGRVIYFKGIPFAQPPVGPLRWRAPQPVKPWDTVLAATEFMPDPPQENRKNTSEDCLYLNIYRTAAPTNTALPVMVWIYGGALANGGASAYPGELLAYQGIIVVTFNYRLGRLGFFAHPALAAERPTDLKGNYGYMDQIAALKWVKKNIASFGGDPANVTIAGESAGAGSVLVLMTSPLARGLFQKAILQSPGLPGAREVIGMNSLYEAEGIAVKYAQSLGIRGDDAAALEKLRAIPTKTLAEGTTSASTAVMGGPEVPGIANSMIDGQLVPDAPENILKANAHTKVPVIVGANDRDLAYSVAENKYDLYSQIGTLAPKARRLYEPKGNMPMEELIQQFIADKVTVEPSRNLADLVTKSGQPAYFYRFSYVPENLRAQMKGALHAMDIPYVFNAPGILQQPVTPGDREMAAVISNYWVSFIKTGDPNNDHVLTYWPRYDRTTRQVLNFTNNGIYYGHDPLQERLDLWQSYWDNARVIAKNRER